MPAPLALHPDRALPVDPVQRSVARTIYGATKDLPLVCMHGHVEARVFADNEAFPDPASLLVTPDHYVTRMLVSQGVALEELGVPREDGGMVETDPRAIWRRLCENWHLFRGTPSRYWLEHELVEVFGVQEQPGAQTSDSIFDAIAARLAEPGFRPQQLLDRFNIELISTTDPATSSLADHQRLADQGLGERVIPTFRPDAVVHLDGAGWRRDVEALGALAGVDTGSYGGYLAALRARREAFVAAGGLATDHGHLTADAEPLSDHDATRIFQQAWAAEISETEAARFTGHMLHVMAGMSCEDGLVMQVHPGVLRNHHTATWETFGADRGFDIPVSTEFVRGAAPSPLELRPRPPLPDHPVHRGRDRLQPRARSAGRRLPVGAPGGSLVVPRQP